MALVRPWVTTPLKYATLVFSCVLTVSASILTLVNSDVEFVINFANGRDNMAAVFLFVPLDLIVLHIV